jgi:magnesium-transporting ATPase (P-type)
MFMMFIGYTKTADELTADRPRSSLFGVLNLFQILTAFIIQAVGQISIIAIYQAYDSRYYWANGGMEAAIGNYGSSAVYTPGLEANILFVFINNIYLAAIIAFNIAKPWRQHFFTNPPLMIMVILSLLLNHIVFFWPAGTWAEFKSGTCLIDYRIRWIFFGVSWGFSLAILILQKCIFEPLSNRLVRKYPKYKWL